MQSTAGAFPSLHLAALPPAPHPRAAAGWAPLPPELVGPVEQWLDTCQEHGVHPDRVGDQLRRAGWPAPWAAAVAAGYRARFDEHALGYSALLVATGVAALAAGTAGHLLASGISGPVDRNELAVWLAVLLCALPFAAWAHRWAARVDRRDPVAAWSSPRRVLADVLLWACGIVGIGRLLVYAVQLVGTLVGATWASTTHPLEGAVNVAIAVGIALPLGLWAFRFRHRFDGGPRTGAEAPAPPAQRRP